MKSQLKLLDYSLQPSATGADKNRFRGLRGTKQRTKGFEHDYARNKLILFLYFWERMINVQSGLRKLVLLGVDYAMHGWDAATSPVAGENASSLAFIVR